MNVNFASLEDAPGWMELAREVEPLFGRMADVPEFQSALREAILSQQAFCVREAGPGLGGGVVISVSDNEIVWLAVARRMRHRGLGEALLKRALASLRPETPAFVTTFASSVSAGIPARALYIKYGFADFRDGELNPAGIPTVVMRRPPEA